MRWIVLLVVVILAVCLLRGCARKVPVAGGTIVFLGDSITAGYGLDPGQSYPSLVHIPGMTIVNLGVSGSKTQDGLQRLKDYFNGGGNARLVVIALGANDILQNVNPAETEANLAGAIQECKSRGAAVLLCGVRIPMKFGTEAIFADAAGPAHVPLLPDLMQGEAMQQNLLQEDSMHPNAAGQQLIAQKMQETLLKSFSFSVGK